MMATLQHHSSVRFYGPPPCLPAAITTSSLHRPHSSILWYQPPPPHNPLSSAELNPHLDPQAHHQLPEPVGTSFWCHTQLFLLTLGLTLLVILNGALLLWILTYLNFEKFSVEESTQAQSESSSSRLSIHGGLRILGKNLEVNSISAPTNEQLQISSQSSVAFGPQTNIEDLPWFQMTSNRIVAYSCNLVVKSSVNENLLLLLQSTSDSAEGKAVIGVDSLKMTGVSGLHLNSSIQVPSVQSSTELFLYSPNQRISLRGPKSVSLSVGNRENASIQMTSAGRLSVHSKSDKIFFNTSRIQFSPRLLTVHPSRHGRTYPSIGQLCVCARTGKIFFASNHPRSCLHVAQTECT